MRICKFPLISFGAPALALFASPVLAANVVYVSATGSNANACDTVAAPCLTLQAAHNRVTSGGEIIVLSAGSYGPISITKPVTIANDGVGVADVSTSAGQAIKINVAGAVHLRGLSLDGGGSAPNGVSVVAASGVTLINCVARRFTGSGVSVTPASGETDVAIVDSSLSDNGRGVNVAPTGTGSVKGTLSNVQAAGNSQYGVAATGPTSMLTVVGGVYSKNGTVLYALNGAKIFARDLVASNNTSYGLFAYGAGAIVRATHMVASGNVSGLRATGGGLGETFGNNNLRGNTNALFGNIATVAPQ